MESLLRPVLAPIRLLATKAMLRTYVRVVLGTIAASTLFVVAVLAYIAFYQTYIPYDELRMPIYFDYSTADSPSTFTSLPDPLVLFPHQAYSVEIHLTVPRTPHNTKLGNFMLSLRLYEADPLAAISRSTDIPVDRLSSTISRHNLALLSSTSEKVASVLQDITLLAARRPAILTYKSDLLDALETVLFFPAYASGWKQQSDVLQVSMINEWVLNNNSKIPRFAAVQLDPAVQVYDARVVFEVEWTGVRWFMRKWYVTSFVVGVGVFWGTELVAAVITWALFGLIFGGGYDEGERRIDELRRMAREVKDQRFDQSAKTVVADGPAKVKAEVEDQSEDVTDETEETDESESVPTEEGTPSVDESEQDAITKEEQEEPESVESPVSPLMRHAPLFSTQGTDTPATDVQSEVSIEVEHVSSTGPKRRASSTYIKSEDDTGDEPERGVGTGVNVNIRRSRSEDAEARHRFGKQEKTDE
ncbi:putative adipose-regulatory protein-domain-containing protein [Lipomyces tetrasporus]|uniref:Adipose-regulatory protein-domain-containing protein n=1 Tax=Lipomyces tetrasporus TaxID=54092 RepID=A0AAD7QNZ4_9ASCO|nr:putative adipose-regulatory protein-domain-containing protein [Lipomyces tetrasporus]KAJ8098613.1 putative adipose-regulatory protein-domain-containing protein [Lipomyces tetrasporus]